MRKLKVFAILLLVLQLTLPFAITADAETDITVHYTAIGDSLAAGMSEKKEIGYGYADYLAQRLGSDELPVIFNKGFAYPGYTTENVLADIKSNVTKPIISLEGLQKNSLSLSEGIAGADLITISAGANDVLKYVTRSETGEVTFDLAGVMQGVQAVATNYQSILGAINEVNPDVELIVMGYYNPFPYLDAKYQAQLDMLVKALDDAVGKVVTANGGLYVKVADVIAENYLTYLPNPDNIHLSSAGYEAVLWINVRYDYEYTG